MSRPSWILWQKIDQRKKTRNETIHWKGQKKTATQIE